MRMSAKKENVKWVDGLRGLASILVVVTHMARAFDDGLFRSTMAQGEPPRVLQWPIVRVFVQGRIGVAIFSLVTGYVCALKPIRQFREGSHDAAFKGIAKSAFRRVPRLVLPTSIVTCLIWILCEFGAFKVAKRTESWWLKEMTPFTKPDVGISIKSLLHALIATWTAGFNPYDPNQWTLPPLLKGAMLVYMMLFATSFCKPRYRMMISLGLYVYYFASSDSLFGMQFFLGVFLSELSQIPSHNRFLTAHPWPFRFLTPLLILTGLLLASYPEVDQKWQYWSSRMTSLSGWIFPVGSDIPRFYTSVGLDFIALGIHFSPGLKSLLSNRYFLWLGRHSYAVYLLHGTLIRTVLVWMYFGIETHDVLKEDGSVEPGPPLAICGRLRWYAWMPLWFMLLYACANAWTRWVDPWCARVTEGLVGYVFEGEREKRGNGGEDEKSLLPQ